MKDLLSKVGLSFVFKIISALLAYPTAIILARELGSEGFGIYGFVIALVGLIIYPVVLGQDQLIIRYSDLIKEHYHRRTNFPLFSFSLQFIWIISLILASLVTITIIIEPSIFGEFTDSILIGVWILPFFAIRRLYTSLLRVLDKAVLAILPETLVQPVTVFFLLLSMLFIFKTNITPQMAISFQLFAYALAMLFVCFFCRAKEVSKSVAIELIEYKPTNNFTWIKAGGVMALMATAEGFAMYIDRFMLGLFRPVEDVGVYLVAARNTGFVLFLESAFLLVTMPLIAKAYAKKENISNIIAVQSLAVFLFTGSFFILFLFFGEWIVGLFGKDFSAAYVPILILSGAYFIGSFFGAGPHILMMTGFENISSNILLSTTCLNVVLNLALIPVYGVLGAAIATLVSEITKKITAYLFMKKKSGLNISVLSFNRTLFNELRGIKK